MANRGRVGRNPMHVRVRGGRRRTPSSTRWLERQLNDPYVQDARREGFRSRAAYKLLELDARFKILPRGGAVIDLGCAPGSWCQAAVLQGCQPVVGIDLTAVEPIAGVVLLQGDIREAGSRDAARAAAGGAVGCVLADMAPPATGHRPTDRLRVAALAEAAADFACSVLAPGGHVAVKVLRAGAETELLQQLRRTFASVRHFKPAASRPESDEIYLVARGFLGAKARE